MAKFAVKMLLTGCGVVGFTGAAFAQTASESQVAAQADADEDAAPGEIIVTAQRREQRLQDVPIAVSVVGAPALAASNYTSATDLQYLTAGVSFNTAFNASFQVRGVGTQSLLITADQSVGVVIDDVVMGIVETTFAGPSYQTLNDIDRVEVLKGPQGTLFGKNASAGVIQMITKNPRLNDRSLDASLSFGERRELNAQAAVNIPLGSNAALRISGVSQRRDGFVRNIYTGGKIYGYQRQGLRAKLLWEPTERLRVLLTGDYRKTEDDANGAWTLRSCGSGFPGSKYFPCAIDTALGIVPSKKNLEVALDGPTYTDQETKLVSLRLDYDLGGATLTSISAYRDLDQDLAVDTDATPRRFYSINRNPSGGKQYTQELRVNGKASIFDYTLGAFYYDAKPFQIGMNYGTLGFVPDTSPISFSIANLGPGIFSGYLPIGRAHVRSKAVFGQLEAAITPQLTLIAGGRYTDDKTTQTVTYFDMPNVCDLTTYLVSGGAKCHPSATPPGPYVATVKADKFTYKLSAKYDITPNFNVYATYATGYKGPLISNPANVALQLVRPETSKSYEIGFKSTLFDNRLVLNVDAFQSTFKDFQATQRAANPLNPANTFPTTANAGSLRTKGVEGDAYLRISPILSLSASAAYIPLKFKDYIVPCMSGYTNPGTGPCTAQIPGTNPPVFGFQAAGFPPVYSPKWTWRLAGDIDQPIGGDHSITAHAEYNYRSKVYAGAGDRFLTVPGFGILNAQVGYGAADGSWRISLFGRNLLDKYFVSGVLATPFDNGTQNANPLPTRGIAQFPAIDHERTLGIKGEVHF